uniref:Uncharacterized protein n=1 Tax=Lepeophtheirus salmonis TaxID=72036 RepID=A0A0K2UJD3_LEPSM
MLRIKFNLISEHFNLNFLISHLVEEDGEMTWSNLRFHSDVSEVVTSSIYLKLHYRK